MPSSDRERSAAAQGRNALLELRTARIRELNDQFRRTFAGGMLTVTAGVRALGTTSVVVIMKRIQDYAAFNDGNDPHDEHDFGSIDGSWGRVFWKIDYYAPSLEEGASDPSNPNTTTRVLTIMLASEY